MKITFYAKLSGITLSLFFYLYTTAQSVPISEELHSINAWYIDCRGSGTQTFAASFTTQLSVIAQSGVRYVRIGGISANWEQLYNFNQSNQNITSATNLTYLINEIRKVGLEPMIQVSFAPSSLTACPVYTPQNGNNPLGSLSDDQQAAIAGNLVEFLNSPYTGTYSLSPITYWIISNEPDHSIGSCSSPGGYGWDDVPNAGSIANYIKKFAVQMKSKDPTIKIIAPEMAAFGNDILNWKVAKLMS
jgi:hypothetical protein